MGDKGYIITFHRSQNFPFSSLRISFPSLRIPRQGPRWQSYYQDLEERGWWGNWLYQGFDLSGWLEQIWPVREQCFRSVHSLEGKWRRHHYLYDPANLELNLQIQVLFSALVILDQRTRSELFLLMQKKWERWGVCLQGLWKINVKVVYNSYVSKCF